MKRFCILFACLMALPLCAHFRNTGYLYKDGEPQGAIYLPALRNGGPVLFAVQELREHLQAMCGTPPPVCFAVQKWAPGIHLEVRPEKLWKGKQSAQAFLLVENGSTVRIQGNTETAVLYGVYQYLEQLAGSRPARSGRIFRSGRISSSGVPAKAILRASSAGRWTSGPGMTRTSMQKISTA